MIAKDKSTSIGPTAGSSGHHGPKGGPQVRRGGDWGERPDGDRNGGDVGGAYVLCWVGGGGISVPVHSSEIV